jgi:hypothetical protein
MPKAEPWDFSYEKYGLSLLQGLPAKSSSDIGIFSLVTVFLALA